MREKSKKPSEKFLNRRKVYIFAVRKDKNGLMAEWLGRGLQNLVRRFDSVWYLKQKTSQIVVSFFYLKIIIIINIFI